MGLGSLSLNQMAGEPQVQPGDAVVALKDIEIWSISRTNKKNRDSISKQVWKNTRKYRLGRVAGISRCKGGAFLKKFGNEIRQFL